MKIHRIQIKSFRNFKDFDVMLGEQVVIAGENKIGKTNLLHALRLVLDPSLPDSARQLQKTDFWDGLGDSLTREHSIEISIELTDFEDDENLIAILAEHLIQPEPMIARLTYVFQPLPTLERDPKSDADYEFFVYGGDRRDNRVGYEVRRRIPLNVLHALRDAERDLATWTHSPLRPLLDEAAKDVDRDELNAIADNVLSATNAVLDIPKATEDAELGESGETIESSEGGTDSEEDEAELEERPIRNLAHQIASRLKDMVGVSQALDTTLGFSPTDPDRLLRAIRLFIDGGKR
ncbi:MAG: AAA family ATPase, partial [Candidatus Thorarchaeota archaeon]